MRNQLQFVKISAATSALLLTLGVVTPDASAQGSSAGQGKGGGNGYAYGRGGGGTNAAGGSAGGAPLPFLGATALGQVAGVGGLVIVWLRRRRRRSAD